MFLILMFKDYNVFFYYFYRREVLEQYKSDGLNRMGPIKPSLALCVFAVFVLVYFSLWKGVRSTGKVSAFGLTYRDYCSACFINLLK